jgi:hypothetical protein
MKWRIYYDDGSIWHHSRGLPPAERRVGVLAILQDSVSGRCRIMSAGDFYLFDGDGWLAVDIHGLVDAVLNNLHTVRCVIAGRMVPDKRFRDVYAKVKRDGDNAALD